MLVFSVKPTTGFHKNNEFLHITSICKTIVTKFFKLLEAINFTKVIFKDFITNAQHF